MRDVTRYLARLRKQGYRTEWTGRSHLKVYAPDGHLVTVTGGTPSDRRAVRNLRARVNRDARKGEAGA